MMAAAGYRSRLKSFGKKVFSFAPLLAGMTPFLITANLKIVTATSRIKKIAVTHQDNMPRSEAEILAVASIALSAIGSSNLPNSVI